ncbi:MAG: hypothetical protein JST00_44355 [Deltaproteobacteria bacterium]|nr:hypothetical protein [Deltaproteobacteria bacterium]
MVARKVFALAAMLVLGACSSGDPPGPAVVGGGFDAGATNDGAATADTGTSGGPTPSGTTRFKIQLDYRFDKAGFFAEPVRRKALEGACEIWGRLLAKGFDNVPAGTFIRVRDPEKPTEPALSLTTDVEIDDLLLFVGSADLAGTQTGLSAPTAGLSGITDGALASKLKQRFDGVPFQPWTAWVAFSRTADFHFDPDPQRGDPVPADKIDFVSVALHEIGHTLGFGSSDAFTSKIVNGTFTGARATAIHGGPVPLTADLGHVPNSTMSDGRRPLMDQSDAKGTRYTPTTLDRAFFEDLGFAF